MEHNLFERLFLGEAAASQPTYESLMGSTSTVAMPDYNPTLALADLEAIVSRFRETEPLPLAIVVPDDEGKSIAELHRAFPNGELAGVAVRVSDTVAAGSVVLIHGRRGGKTAAQKQWIESKFLGLPIFQANVVKISDIT